MKIVVFGLSISSSWGNGHATLWRGLCRALGFRGHEVVFFERDVSWYAENRDGTEFPGCDLRLYSDWKTAVSSARAELHEADAAFVTSYCPDGIAASELILESSARIRGFYDLDTPVTLSRLNAGQTVEYLPPEGLAGFDIVLSYTGGRALDQLRTRLHARKVAPLYGSVDPDVHRVAPPEAEFAGDLSYLGTWAADRQHGVERFLIEPARLRPDMKFIIGGAQYPKDFPWTPNIWFVRHLPPALHPAFYSSSRLTLNVTREAMAEMGYCPSGRLFEAAACGVPIVSDWWEGLDAFYTPDTEILICRDSQDVLAALDCADSDLMTMARRARERTLAEHTAAKRAQELEAILESTFNTGRKEELCGA